MSTSTFHIEQMTPFEPQENPMLQDRFHMGDAIGTNVFMLHRNFPHEEMGYLILVHLPTGQRLKITFPENDPTKISGEIMNVLLGGVT